VRKPAAERRLVSIESSNKQAPSVIEPTPTCHAFGLVPFILTQEMKLARMAIEGTCGARRLPHYLDINLLSPSLMGSLFFSAPGGRVPHWQERE
jgi:hypothetical protein